MHPIPWESRFLVVIASLLLRPGRTREDFRLQWLRALSDHARFAAERNLNPPTARQRLRRHALQSWTAASESRWAKDGFRGALRRSLRTARFATLASAAFFLFGFFASSAFQPLRVAHRPLPVDEPARLATLAPTQTAFSPNPGLSPYQLLLLRRNSESFLDRTEAFAPRWAKVSFPNSTSPRWTGIGVATEGLFPMLGYSFAPGAVLGHEFGSNHPELLGRRITLWDQSYLITGILPPGIRLSAHRPDVWITMSQNALERHRFAMVVVARMAPGLDAVSADLEFQKIAAKYQPFTQQHLVPLRNGLATLTDPVAGLLLLLLILVAARTLYRFYRGYGSLRYESFFLLRNALLLTGLAGLVMAQLARYGSFYTIFLIVWIGFVAALMIVYGCLRDHGLRCRQCLARMTLPVRIGNHGSSLLEGVGSELICENGHGTLWMPGTGAQAFGPEVWRAA